MVERAAEQKCSPAGQGEEGRVERTGVPQPPSEICPESLKASYQSSILRVPPSPNSTALDTNPLTYLVDTYPSKANTAPQVNLPLFQRYWQKIQNPRVADEGPKWWELHVPFVAQVPCAWCILFVALCSGGLLHSCVSPSCANPNVLHWTASKLAWQGNVICIRLDIKICPISWRETLCLS